MWVGYIISMLNKSPSIIVPVGSNSVKFTGNWADEQLVSKLKTQPDFGSFLVGRVSSRVGKSRYIIFYTKAMKMIVICIDADSSIIREIIQSNTKSLDACHDCSGAYHELVKLGYMSETGNNHPTHWDRTILSWISDAPELQLASTPKP